MTARQVPAYHARAPAEAAAASCQSASLKANRYMATPYTGHHALTEGGEGVWAHANGTFRQWSSSTSTSPSAASICRATTMAVLDSGQRGASMSSVRAATGSTARVNISSTVALTQAPRDGRARRNGQLASSSVGMRQLARRPMTPKKRKSIGNASIQEAG